jgi:hypothetical protein
MIRILNWDFVFGSCTNNLKTPIIFFKPTVEILNLLHVNNNKLWITINDTENPLYDGKSFFGVVDKSSIPNPYIPDMYPCQQIYTITFMDYCAPFELPKENGYFSINKTIKKSNCYN